MKAKLRIDSVFDLKNIGIVFVGKLLTGSFGMCDLITFQYKNNVYESKISGIAHHSYTHETLKKIGLDELLKTKSIRIEHIPLFDEPDFDKALLENQIVEIQNI